MTDIPFSRIEENGYGLYILWSGRLSYPEPILINKNELRGCEID